MIIFLSPSKNMDMHTTCQKEHSKPLYLYKSEKLINKLRNLSIEQLSSFMDISNKLATLNHNRIKNWHPNFTLENSKAAILAFTGDVYDGLNASSLSDSDKKYAQNHIRILSGLYGVLRPLDLIQPYRLEMGRQLETESSKNLYDFWAEAIENHIKNLSNEPIINLASQEYFKVVPKEKLPNKVISPIFKDEKNGKFKIISFYAKKARGLMARFLIDNKAKTSEYIQKFNLNGYAYDEKLSTPSQPVFLRPESVL